MDIKEQIHELSEEMLNNLGRLVAIDSQLGTPAEGMPFGEGPAKALEEGLKIADELGFRNNCEINNHISQRVHQCGNSSYQHLNLCQISVALIKILRFLFLLVKGTDDTGTV